MSRTAVLLVLLALPSLAHAQVAVRDVRTIARVLATAGIAGRFGEAVCEGERTVEPSELARFTGALAERQQEATRRSCSTPAGCSRPTA